MASVATVGQLMDMGRRAADHRALLYGEAGAGEEVTVARNRDAFRRIALRSRVLRDVSTVDTSTTVLGLPLRAPVMLAPVGAVAMYGERGATDVAVAAVQHGTVAMIGMLAEPAYGEVVADCGRPQVFQMAAWGDRGWMGELVARVDAAGCAGICVTVDGPVLGRRDRLMEAGADHRMARRREPPTLLGLGRDRASQARFTWDELEWLRGATALPLVLKGVMHPDDAARAVATGVDAVYVSNHGGRLLDHGLSTVEALPAIVEAVGDRAEVLMDGGVRRGTDVVKALALGARAVLVGRAQCWALAAGGAAGVGRLLELLTEEVRTAMAFMGLRTLDELGPGSVAPTFAPAPSAGGAGSAGLDDADG